jgi:phage-related protein
MATRSAGTVSISFNSITKGLEDGVGKVKGKLGEVGGGVKNLGKGFVDFGKTVTVGLGVGAASVGAFGLSVLGTVSNYESLQAGLETALGSQEAAATAFENINKFAAETPYSLQEVTKSFVFMKNMGLDASDSSMKAWGNWASSIGKSFDDVTQAVADAVVGEYERLKEFGVRTQVQGDKVSFTFKGVTTTVGKNSKEIEGYLKGLSEANFAGGMEKQSKTVGGMWSTLRDQFDQTIVKIATSTGFTDFTKMVMGEASKLMGRVDELFAFFEANLPVIKASFISLGVAIAAFVIPTLGIMAISAIAATWPFLLFAAVIAGLAFAWQTDFGGMRTTLMQFWGIVQPILFAIGDVIMQVLWPALQQMWAALVNLWNVISPILIPILQFLGVVIGVIIVGVILIVIGIFTLFASIITWVADTISWFVTGTINNWNGFVDGIKWGIDQAKGGFDNLMNFLGGFQQAWQNTWNGVGDFFKGIWDGIANTGKKALNNITGGINKVINGFNSISGAVGVPAIPTIPGFAGGGIVGNPVMASNINAGDDQIITAKTGELIANQSQKDKLLQAIMNGKGGNSEKSQNIQITALDSQSFETYIKKHGFEIKKLLNI